MSNKNFEKGIRSCRRLWWLGYVLMMFAVSLQKADAQSERQRFRLMSFNTHHSEGVDGNLDLERVARVITSQGPTHVALQELDSVTTRTKKVYQLAEFTRLTGMYGVFAKAIPYQGGSYGNGILSKEKPLSVKSVPIPGEEPRVLLMAEFDNYVFASTHLDGGEAYLDSAFTIIRKESVKWKKPFFIAGDWNCRPNNKFITKLKQYFIIVTDEFSVPNDIPTYCIDYIAVMNRYATFNVIRKWVMNGSLASDHCATCAIVDMYPPAGVGSVETAKDKFAFSGNSVMFPQPDDVDRVSIRTFDGREIYGGEPRTVSLTPGNYVIMVDNDAVKVNVK